jgi:hypothetical protein
MKEKMLLIKVEDEDVERYVSEDEDVMGLVSDAETDVYRIMKYDIDSFMAK